MHGKGWHGTVVERWFKGAKCWQGSGVEGTLWHRMLQEAVFLSETAMACMGMKEDNNAEGDKIPCSDACTGVPCNVPCQLSLCSDLCSKALPRCAVSQCLDPLMCLELMEKG